MHARNDLGLALLAAALVALPYLGGLDNGFVWIDHFEIVEGAVLIDSPGELLDVLRDDENSPGYQRPVYNLVHTLDRALWGLEPAGYHLSSLVYHLVNVVLVALLLARLGLGGKVAAAIACVWGLHPVNSAAVGLVHAKADLVVVTLLLVALTLRERALGAPRRALAWSACSLAAFALALLTKESAFLYAPALTLAWCHTEPAQRGRAARYLAAAWALTGLAVAGRYALLARAVPVGAPDFQLGERLATFGAVYLDYLRVLALPLRLSLADTVTRYGALAPADRVWIVTGCALVAGVQLVAAWRARWLLRWVLLFNLALLPVAQIVPLLHFRAERFLYLPSLAFAGALVEGAVRAGQRLPRAVLPLALLTCLGLYAARIADRVALFRDDLTLFEHELRATPDYAEGLQHLARSLDRRGRHAAAEPYYRRCAEVPPERISYRHTDTLVVNWSSNLLALERYADAYELLRAALPAVRGSSHHEKASYNFAVAAYYLEREAEARPIFEAYSRAHPDYAPAHFFAGFCAWFQGDEPAARAAFARYLTLGTNEERRREVQAALAEME